MAALVYLFLPVSGLVAFLTGGSARLRFHGLQAVVFGTVWAAALYLGSALAAGVTVVVWILGAVAWVALMTGAGVGRDPSLPFLGEALWRVARSER